MLFGIRLYAACLQRLLPMSYKNQGFSSDYEYNLLTNNDGPEHYNFTRNSNIFRTYVIPLMLGGMVGICFAQLYNYSFPKYTLYQNYDLSIEKRYQENIFHKIHFGSHWNDNENKTIADKLAKDVRVLCWIMTSPANHWKAQHVKRTWGARCNKLIFMSSKEDNELGAVGLPVPEGHQNLWAKTKAAFKYIYDHHLDEYDWFLKADDDTYVIVENLRSMLYSYNTEFPIYLGCKLKFMAKQGYMSGGAGYVLSREALKRFIEKALPDATKCRQEDNSAEDVEMGKCMENVEVLAGDSRDEYERGRMFPFQPVHHLSADLSVSTYWYYPAMYYKSDEGIDCCSDHAISFHYIKPQQMYLFEYLIYHLRPFGVMPFPDVLPDKKSLDEIIRLLSIHGNNSTSIFTY